MSSRSGVSVGVLVAGSLDRASATMLDSPSLCLTIILNLWISCEARTKQRFERSIKQVFNEVCVAIATVTE